MSCFGDVKYFFDVVVMIIDDSFKMMESVVVVPPTRCGLQELDFFFSWNGEEYAPEDFIFKDPRKARDMISCFC